MTSDHEKRGAERLAAKPRELREEAGAAAREARVDVEARVEGARREAEAQLDEGRARSASAARRVADALDDAAVDMDERSPARPALGRAADGARNVADLIDDNTIGDAADALAGFARRNPAAFLGVAALTGFALSRFATATPEDDRVDREDDLDDEHGAPSDHAYAGAGAPADPLSDPAAPRPVASPTEAIPPRAPAPAPGPTGGAA